MSTKCPHLSQNVRKAGKASENRTKNESGNDYALTPSMFANRHAKGRNAWRFVWLRFPGDDYWVRAANCRMHSDDLAQKAVYKHDGECLTRSIPTRGMR
jgi:hypothetical protein